VPAQQLYNTVFCLLHFSVCRRWQPIAEFFFLLLTFCYVFVGVLLKKYDGIIRERTVHACVDRSFNRTIQMWLCSKLMPMKQRFVLSGYRIGLYVLCETTQNKCITV